MPASPLELLRFLTSPEHRRAVQEELEQVRRSYELLEGCPWPAPRPLFLLATPAAGDSDEGDAGATHTHRTLLPRADIEGEMDSLLGGRRRQDGSPLIRCGQIVDGVVAFEDEGSAERYGAMLEEGGAAGVAVARCDSHALFRAVRDARGVVVFLRPAPFVPRPHQLAAALRGQAAPDDQ